MHGCAREKSEITKVVDKTQLEIADYLAIRNINWYFNSPDVPHFEDLWETRIEAAKYHLKQIVGPAPINLEELITVIARFEEILNSMPFCSVSAFVNDNLDTLTPNHFVT